MHQYFMPKIREFINYSTTCGIQTYNDFMSQNNIVYNARTAIHFNAMHDSFHNKEFNWFFVCVQKVPHVCDSCHFI